MATSNGKVTDLSPAVTEWLDRLAGLVEEVQTWAEAAGWKTNSAGVDLTEQGFGRYEAPVLVLVRDEVVVSLVPVTRQVPGALGLVDLYLMPDFDDVASLYLQQPGRWFVHYAFHSDPMVPRSITEAERRLLDQSSLMRVLDDIATHA